MIRKQLLFALRRLGRHKLTTTLNVLGLSVGILSCLIIYLYVAFECSYDRFHPDSKWIYGVVIAKRGAGGIQDNDGAATAGAVGVTRRLFVSNEKIMARKFNVLSIGRGKLPDDISNILSNEEKPFRSLQLPDYSDQKVKITSEIN